MFQEGEGARDSTGCEASLTAMESRGHLLALEGLQGATPRLRTGSKPPGSFEVFYEIVGTRMKSVTIS